MQDNWQGEVTLWQKRRQNKRTDGPQPVHTQCFCYWLVGGGHVEGFLTPILASIIHLLCHWITPSFLLNKPKPFSLFLFWTDLIKGELFAGTMSDSSCYLFLMGGSCFFLVENTERDLQKAWSLHSFKPATSQPAPSAVNGDVIWCDRRMTLGQGPLWMKDRVKKTTTKNKSYRNQSSKTYNVCQSHPLSAVRQVTVFTHYCHLNPKTLSDE